MKFSKWLLQKTLVFLPKLSKTSLALKFYFAVWKSERVQPYCKHSYTKNCSCDQNMFFIQLLLKYTKYYIFILVCVVVCIIKRNRGGKYAVQESEERQGRRDPYDDGGFPEYTKP